MPAEDALGHVLENLSSELAGLDPAFHTVAAVTGFLMVGGGLFKLAHRMRNDEGPVAGLSSIVCGILLFGLNAFIQAASISLFEEEAGLTSQISHISARGIFLPYIRFAVTIVVLLGIVSMIKGLLRLREAGMGREESLWPGLTHLLAGIVCVNIVTFVRFFGESAGGVVHDLIEKLFS